MFRCIVRIGINQGQQQQPPALLLARQLARPASCFSTSRGHDFLRANETYQHDAANCLRSVYGSQNQQEHHLIAGCLLATTLSAAGMILSNDDTAHASPKSSFTGGSQFDVDAKYWSNNGEFYFTYQHDGNFVVYNKHGKAQFASSTNGESPGAMLMQEDGNLVIYNGNDRAVWASNTSGNAGATLAMQDDGNLVIYNSSGGSIFAIRSHRNSGKRLKDGHKKKDFWSKAGIKGVAGLPGLANAIGSSASDGWKHLGGTLSNEWKKTNKALDDTCKQAGDTVRKAVKDINDESARASSKAIQFGDNLQKEMKNAGRAITDADKELRKGLDDAQEEFKRSKRALATTTAAVRKNLEDAAKPVNELAKAIAEAPAKVQSVATELRNEMSTELLKAGREMLVEAGSRLLACVPGLNAARLTAICTATTVASAGFVRMTQIIGVLIEGLQRTNESLVTFLASDLGKSIRELRSVAGRSFGVLEAVNTAFLLNLGVIGKSRSAVDDLLGSLDSGASKIGEVLAQVNELVKAKENLIATANGMRDSAQSYVAESQQKLSQAVQKLGNDHATVKEMRQELQKKEAEFESLKADVKKAEAALAAVKNGKVSMLRDNIVVKLRSELEKQGQQTLKGMLDELVVSVVARAML